MKTYSKKCARNGRLVDGERDRPTERGLREPRSQDLPNLKKTASERVTLTIDGRKINASKGRYVLDVARDMGIEIPTLCDHPPLEPAGACRLCLVEVTHPSWGGWRGLMTSCIYPTSEGIEVSTNNERVVKARRGILSLLAARCPSSSVIKKLAERYKVNTDGLFKTTNADNCILCGLCARVCQAYASGAISTLGRGETKKVGTFFDKPSEACVGCGGCALLCPTGNIKALRSRGRYTIWGQTLKHVVCSVDVERCSGCGSCEEACPFSVARIVLTKDGARTATIPEQHCRGCGACVGVCPSGSIEQRPDYGWSQLSSIIREPARHEREETGVLRNQKGGQS
jgi:NADH dehydrogenase/NADH:ubiquinone oxidoreductase subunit G